MGIYRIEDLKPDVPEKAYAVVLDLTTITGLTTVRSLFEKKVPVISFTNDKRLAFSKTRMCKAIIYNEDLSKANIVQLLLSLGKKLGKKSVLILTSDEQVEAISQKREVLSEYFLFNLPEPETVDLLLHKTKFHDFAEMNGIPEPKSLCIHSDSQIDGIPDKLMFPMILKPVTRTKEWNEKFYKVIKIKDQDELNSIGREALKVIDEFIIQEYIDGSDSDIHFCLTYFDRNSDPKATFAGKKIRQWVPEYGTTASAEKKYVPEVLDEALKLFKLVNYKGIGSVEFKYDRRDRKYKIMEPTVGRLNQQNYVSVANGINIPYTAYCDLLDLPYKKQLDNENRKSNIRWINDFSEYQAAHYYIKKKQLTFTSWIKFMTGKKRFALLYYRDPVPFLLTYKNWTKFIIKKRIRRK